MSKNLSLELENEILVVEPDASTQADQCECAGGDDCPDQCEWGD